MTPAHFSSSISQGWPLLQGFHSLLNKYNQANEALSMRQNWDSLGAFYDLSQSGHDDDFPNQDMMMME